MTELLVNLLNGLTYASVLALVASGLALIFGFLHIVNFSHGAMFMIGAYLAYTVQRETGSFVLAVVAAIVGVALLALLMDLVLFRFMRGAQPTDFILVTFGVLLILENVVHMVWGTTTYNMARPSWFDGSLSVFGQSYPTYRLFLIGASAAVAVAGWVVLSKTPLGRQIRAVVEDREMGLALGIDSVRLVFVVLAVGGGLAGLAGALGAPYFSVRPTMGTDVLIDAFLVVSVAGLGNFLATFWGAYLIGITYTIGNAVVPQYAFALVLTVVIAALLWRPDGVFVRKKVVR